MNCAPALKVALLLILIACLTGQAEADSPDYLLFKGFNVTFGCIDGLMPVPYHQPVFGQNVLLSCTATEYADDDTLVYDRVATSCQTLADFLRDRPDEGGTAFLTNSPIEGNLPTVSGALFSHDKSAVLAMNARTGEILLAESTACPQAGGPIFADGFE